MIVQVGLLTFQFQVGPPSRCYLVEGKERGRGRECLPPNGDYHDDKMMIIKTVITQAETMTGAFRHSISLVPQEPEDITNFTCIAGSVHFFVAGYNLSTNSRKYYITNDDTTNFMCIPGPVHLRLGPSSFFLLLDMIK